MQFSIVGRKCVANYYYSVFIFLRARQVSVFFNATERKELNHLYFYFQNFNERIKIFAVEKLFNEFDFVTLRI